MNADYRIIAGVLAFGGICRVIADRMDRTRIRDHLAAKGAKDVAIQWDPFGPGWFGEKSDRIYEVTYTNQKGRKTTAHCKTSMLSGVYWTNENKSEEMASEESVECLSCGTIMMGTSKCPKCGWTYKN